MRRENGTGTIYKIKDRKLRKPFKVIVVTGYSLDSGNPIRKVLGYYGKASEATEALNNYLKNKNSFDLKKLTLKEIFDRWWVVHKTKIKQNTIDSYKSCYKKYISKLNDKVFSELKTLELQEFFNKEIKGWTTQYLAKNILKSLYIYALKYEIVDKDYSKFIELVKRERVIKRAIFTEIEREAIFQSNNKICKAVTVLIYTGLRIDEFLSLKRENIENGFIFVDTSKTDAGIRTIPIHPKIKNIIDEFLEDNGEYLFCWKNNEKKVVYETFRRLFHENMQEMGMEHTIHDTRHTFASMLNQVGANDVIISSLAGHEDKEFTKRVYTHTELEDLEKTIKLLQ
nr:MAG TPA: Integrase [Caudoviricetes sp.]